MIQSPKITSCLWFDNQGEEASTFYTSIFPDSRINTIQRQGEAVVTVQFILGGQSFMALNGGPMFTFNPSTSFYVLCETEQEIDETWAKLSEGGKTMMPLDTYDWSAKYGWVEDKYGVSWQLTLGNISDVGQKISPVLMFTGAQHGKAEEAMNVYLSIFSPSAVNLIARYEEGEGDPAVGTIKHSEFKLGENIFMAMDSSFEHGFTFNEAISFVVYCKNQEEIDYYWEKLTANGGEEMMCAWLKDPYGVTWQIIPEELIKLISDPDPARAQRAAGAMMQMRKIDIEKIRQAADDDQTKVITIQTTINTPIKKVWDMWTQPTHITKWHFATESWHCPRAENNLSEGGRFSYRMEAKDGSIGFDFGGMYTSIQENKSLEYVLDDGRTVQIHFSEVDGGTFIMENFEAEAMTPIEMQKGGWQALLNNFKRYAEGD